MNQQPVSDGSVPQVGEEIKHKLSLSSIANTFFGDENMSASEFQKEDYRETQGYKDYVDQCVNNLRQNMGADFDEVTARKEVEDSIAGIVRVAIAAKQAGYVTARFRQTMHPVCH